MKWTCGETCKSYWISILPKSLCKRISKEFLWYLKWEFVWNDCFTPFMHIILSNITIIIIILFQITSHVSTWLRFHGDGMLCHLAPIIAPCVSPPTIIPPLAWSSKNKIETYCNHLKSGLVQDQSKTVLEIEKSKMRKMNGYHGTTLMVSISTNLTTANNIKNQSLSHFRSHYWNFPAQSISERAAESHGCKETHTWRTSFLSKQPC